MSDGKLTPDGSSKAKFFAAVAPKPVFQFTSHGAGEIHVTEMRANTLEKIVFEFEKSDADEVGRNPWTPTG